MVAPLFALLSFLAFLHAPSPAASTATGPREVSVTISGRVTDVETGRPVAAAQIAVQGEAFGALSNADGRYSISLGDAWAGRQVELRIQAIGYRTEVRTLTLASGTNVMDLALQPVALVLDQLVVTAQAATAKRRAQGAVMRPAQALRGRFNPDFNTESYALIEENQFRAAGPNPLSTFSIDVDRASYANVRRYIRQGERPPIDAVRIEELVNYFTYADPAPDADVPFSVTTEVAPAPWQPLHRLVRIGLKAREVAVEDLPPNNLVFLVDVSGSMRRANKLPLVKTALGMLVNQLRPQDRVALVVYAGAAGLVLPPTAGSEKRVIHDAIERLEAGGSTAGGEGLALAYRVAADNHMTEGNNRIILATDGDFNVGPSSDAEMVRLIEEKREQGTFLTVLGFGTGNLQDSKMEQLADHGNGNFAYIDSALEAKKALVTEMGGTLLTVAKDVKIQVEFNPARVAAYRLIGYENRLLAAEDFDDDTEDAGEMGAGHSVVALYEVIPVGVESPAEVRGIDSLRYQDAPTRSGAAASPELLFVKVRYKDPDGSESRLLSRAVLDETGAGSENLRFAAAVAAWGMLLRGSEHCAGYELADVVRLARASMGEDREGYRAEFVQLVEATRSLELLKDPVGEK